MLLLPPALLILAAWLTVLGAWAISAADRAAPAEIGVRELAVWSREAMARVAFTLLRPLDWLLRDRPPALHTGETLVVLVGDPTLPTASLSFLATFLRGRGRTVYCMRPRARETGTLGDLAEDLARRASEAQTRSGASRIDLVGHGVGGLVAAWYVARLEGDQSCRRLVTLATAWEGTRLAVFGRHPVHTELQPSSPTLVDLSASAVPTVSVFSPDDPFIVPGDSASPRGVHAVRIEGAGHHELLLSARAYRATWAALTEPLGGSR